VLTLSCHHAGLYPALHEGLMCLDIYCCAICIHISCSEDICCLCLYSISFSGIFPAVCMYAVVCTTLRIFPAVRCVQYSHCKDIYCCALCTGYPALRIYCLNLTCCIVQDAPRCCCWKDPSLGVTPLGGCSHWVPVI
jgi:hypothetical protein